MHCMKRFTVDLPEELHRELKLHCVASDINMAEVIRELIEEYLQKAKEKKKR